MYLPALRGVVDVVDPWALTSAEEIARAAALHRDREMAREIGRRNIEAIRSSALLVAHLDGQEPDSGTVAELGFAAGLGLPCFAVRSDLRQAGEPGARVNLQVEAFVIATGGRIASGLSELVSVLSEHIAMAPEPPSCAGAQPTAPGSHPGRQPLSGSR